MRNAIFISHANPEDNDFTLWLGAKLSAFGYEVWADLLRLRGGIDWSRKLEEALRKRATKVLLVANACAVEKQGVRNEIQIASDVAKKIGDHEFIIPLRTAPFEPPFEIVQAQYIDFQSSWSRGLRELTETLYAYHVPQSNNDSASLWRNIQLLHAKELTPKPETLISNWLRIKHVPQTIRYYDFQSPIDIDQVQKKIRMAPKPATPFHRGFLSFAPLEDLQSHFGANLSLTVKAHRDLEVFLEKEWLKLGILPMEARKHFTDLSRQAFERFLEKKGLLAYELSSGQKAWWTPVGIGPDGMIPFKWGDLTGRRQIQGFSNKRSVYWHFGIRIQIHSRPPRHARLLNTLIFTSDGRKPLSDPKRMHRLRRSFARSWRNPRWRDMLLAFLCWLSDSGEEIRMPVSSKEEMVFALPPMSWLAPVSIPAEPGYVEPDLDDPDESETSSWLDDYFEYGDGEEDEPL